VDGSTEEQSVYRAMGEAKELGEARELKAMKTC
jgi:hypothetical protein